MLANEALLTSAWLLYAAASALLVYAARRHGPRWLAACAVAAACAADLAAPMSYTLPRQQVSALVVPFVLTLMRPFKLVLMLCDRGPLAGLASARDFAVVANLPVMPLACLAPALQKRMRAYRPTRARGVELAVLGAAIPLGASLMRLYTLEESSQAWRRLVHMFVFSVYASFLFNLAAALSSYAARGVAIIAPFNEFWAATSLADWWAYRWDTVFAVIFRQVAFDPVRTALSRTKLPPGGAVAAAALCTFGVSALVHEYAMVAQGQPSALGHIWRYFMAQPLLLAAEPSVQKLARSIARASRVSPTGEALAQRAVAIALIVLPIYYLWAPVYDPPYGTLNNDSADAVLQLVRLCNSVPQCRSGLEV